MRCEITFIPAPEDPFTLRGSRWLGRDAYADTSVPTEVEGLTAADHAFLTVLPRRAGFHATLKPPFALREGCTHFDLERRLAVFAQGLQPVCAQLKIDRLDSFFAYVPCGPVPDLMQLAANVVAEFDSFREPMSSEDIDRRSAARLNAAQLSNLAKWGSPYVFDQYHFHMTLTGPVDRVEREHVALVLRRYFGAAPVDLRVDRLVLAVQREVHEPFRIHSIHPFADAEASELRMAV